MVSFTIPAWTTRRSLPLALLVRLSGRQFSGTVVRTVGFTVTALVCGLFDFGHHVDHAWWFAIRVGLVIGIVNGVGATVNP